jgi:hypothetical protein
VSNCKSLRIRELIRKRVKEGIKTKRQVAEEFGVSVGTVYKYTRGTCYTPFRGVRVQDRKLEFLNDLFTKGYAIPCNRYDSQEYYRLKPSFPTIHKVNIYHRTIFFLEGRENEAALAILETLHKRVFTYQELKDITDAFHARLDREEKLEFLENNKARFEKKKPVLEETV